MNHKLRVSHSRSCRRQAVNAAASLFSQMNCETWLRPVSVLRQPRPSASGRGQSTINTCARLWIESLAAQQTRDKQAQVWSMKSKHTRNRSFGDFHCFTKQTRVDRSHEVL